MQQFPFSKVLIANRGEIAVRVLRTLHDLELQGIALYEEEDKRSLHIRLSNECAPFESSSLYQDQDAIIRIAQEMGAGAIHPGYGYLSEMWEFAAACDQAGIAFVGPRSQILAEISDRRSVLERVHQAGFPTAEFSSCDHAMGDLESLKSEARQLGYPVAMKTCVASEVGRRTWILKSVQQLETVVLGIQREASDKLANRMVYLEKGILPANLVRVQVLGDRFGNIVHFGEREASIMLNNRKYIEESPSPSLTQDQRGALACLAVEIAHLFSYDNAGSVEFLVDKDGKFYFTKIKPCIQMGHPVTEMVFNIDLVAEQLRIAAGEPLPFTQQDLVPSGFAMQSRINAMDPDRNFLPSPGRLRHVRLPAGPNVRVDSYIYCGYDVSERYDPTLAKIVVWGRDRQECFRRLHRSLDETHIIGIPTDISLHQIILNHPDFQAGRCTTEFVEELLKDINDAGTKVETTQLERDLAVAAAVIYARRSSAVKPVIPDRLLRGWHVESRRGQ